MKPNNNLSAMSQCQSQCQSSTHLSKKPLITHQSSLNQHSHLLCKISVSSANKQYSLPVYINSTIKELANQLILKLNDYQDIDGGYEGQEVREQVCLLLIKEIQNTIGKQQLNHDNIRLLKNVVKQYFRQKQSNYHFVQRASTDSVSVQHQSTDSMRYFKQNFIESHFHKQKKSSSKLNHSDLYQKAQKSLQKKVLIQKQHKQQKDQQQKRNCTFKPKIIQKQKGININNKSISISNQKKCVFQRLYEDAQQIQIKKHYKLSQQKTQTENQQYKQCKFIPQINKCSKQIMKLKFRNSQAQPTEQTILNEQFKQNMIANHSNKKYIIEQLFDSNFYQNRMNKTLQKHNKQNFFTFHPELSQGTKRITQQYPKFQKRLAMQHAKKHQNQRTTKKDKQNIANQSFCSNSKEKSFKKRGIKQSSQKKCLLRMNTLEQNFKSIKNKNEYNNKKNDQRHKAKPSQTNNPQTIPKKMPLHFFSQQFNQTITPQKPSKPTPFQKALSSLTQNKSLIFNNLFDHLTKNKQISWIDLNETKIITKEIREMMRPLVLELRNMDTTLDKEQFGWSMENLYQELTHRQRNLLVQWAVYVNHHNTNRYINYDQLKHVKTQDSVFQLIQ